MITQTGKPQDASDLINGVAAITVVIYVLSWYLDLQAHPFQGLKSRASYRVPKGGGGGVNSCLYVEKLNSLHPEYEQEGLLRPPTLQTVGFASLSNSSQNAGRPVSQKLLADALLASC